LETKVLMGTYLMETQTRRETVTETILTSPGHTFQVSVGFHPLYGTPLEIALSESSRPTDFPSSIIKTALKELGGAASKIMQDYDKSAKKITELEAELQKAMVHIQFLKKLASYDLEMDD
jgi:hypothetical protein